MEEHQEQRVQKFFLYKLQSLPNNFKPLSNQDLIRMTRLALEVPVGSGSERLVHLSITSGSSGANLSTHKRPRRTSLSFIGTTGVMWERISLKLNWFRYSWRSVVGRMQNVLPIPRRSQGLGDLHLKFCSWKSVESPFSSRLKLILA